MELQQDTSLPSASNEEDAQDVNPSATMDVKETRDVHEMNVADVQATVYDPEEVANVQESLDDQEDVHGDVHEMNVVDVKDTVYDPEEVANVQESLDDKEDVRDVHGDVHEMKVVDVKDTVYDPEEVANVQETLAMNVQESTHDRAPEFENNSTDTCGKNNPPSLQIQHSVELWDSSFKVLVVASLIFLLLAHNTLTEQQEAADDGEESTVDPALELVQDTADDLAREFVNDCVDAYEEMNRKSLEIQQLLEQWHSLLKILVLVCLILLIFLVAHKKIKDQQN